MSDEGTSCNPVAGVTVMLMCAQIIQREVELQDIYPRFAEETELLALGLLCDECRHVTLGQVPLAGDAGDLVIRCSDADIRIEAAPRGGDEIDRNRLGIGRIGRMEGIDPGLYLIDESRVGRADIRAGGYRGIIGYHACGRETTPEIFRGGERLADEGRTDNFAIVLDEIPVCLDREDYLCNTGNDERVQDTRDQGDEAKIR